MTYRDLIKDGNIRLDGCDYITDSGVRLIRTYISWRSTAPKWKREDDGFVYRSLFDAYYRNRY